MDSQKELLYSFLEEYQKGNGINVRTSGSTGEPKTIVLPKAVLERSARRTNAFFCINRKSRLHSAISFNYIGGKMMIVRAILSGCRLTFSEPSMCPGVTDDGIGVNLMSVVAAQMPYILDNISLFENVENFLIGGSAIDDRLWNRISSSGINAWESYGMTETASHIALRRVVGPAERRPRFVALPGVKLRRDEEDCLIIQDGDNIVYTNDIAYLNSDGSFEIKGRRDDIINTGGIKVLPQSVERVLKAHISHLCRDYFITSLPDEVWTSKIVLVAVRPDSTVSTDSVLIASLRHAIDSIPLETLPKKLRPKEILITDELPLTPSGKLNRRFNN